MPSRPSWQAWDTASPSVSLIEVLYRFHQNNDVSISEVAHTSPPIPPLRSPASNQRRGIMALQPHTLECIFGSLLHASHEPLAYFLNWIRCIRHYPRNRGRGWWSDSPLW